MVYRTSRPNCAYRTRQARNATGVRHDGQEDRTRRALPLPGLRGLLEADRRQMSSRASCAASAVAACADFGEQRLAPMDKAGIERAVLSLAGPGVQIERDTATASRNAKDVQRLPGAGKSRSGRTAIPASRIFRMQDPPPPPTSSSAASRELEILRRHDQRPHQRGQYLDHPSLSPFWERAEALGALIYLHPTDPVTPSPRCWKAIRAAPRHLGMDLRDRLACAAAGVRRHVRPLPARHARRSATWARRCRSCSGASTAAPSSTASSSPKTAVALHQGQHRGDHVGHVLGRSRSTARIAALGHEHVMFAADYPFEQAEEAAEFIDGAPLAR